MLMNLTGNGPMFEHDDGLRFYVIAMATGKVLAGPMPMPAAVREVQARIDIGGAVSMEIKEIDYSRDPLQVGDRVADYERSPK